MGIREFERRLNLALETVLAVTLFLVFAVIVSLVILRYFFGTGVVGANESATIAFVYASAIGAALAVGKDEHIRVDFLVQKCGRRARKALHAASIILVGVLNVVLFERSIEWIRVTGDYLMPATQLPRMVAQIAVPIGCGIAVIYSLTRLVVTLRGSAAE